jgi:hypothetical protein
VKTAQEALGGVVGFVLFMGWLHGRPAVLRATARYLDSLADEMDRPVVMLTSKQVGALVNLALLDPPEER